MNIFKAGKIYRVRHSRKGIFTVKITGTEGEWVHGVIWHGMAKAMLNYNEKLEGDEITMRACFLSIVEEISFTKAEGSN